MFEGILVGLSTAFSFTNLLMVVVLLLVLVVDVVVIMME